MEALGLLGTRSSAANKGLSIYDGMYGNDDTPGTRPNSIWMQQSRNGSALYMPYKGLSMPDAIESISREGEQPRNAKHHKRRNQKVKGGGEFLIAAGSE